VCEYEDDEELDEDAPEVEVIPPSRPPPRLQTARINPAALDMLSGALELLTPADAQPKPTGPRTRISSEALLMFSTDPAAPPPDVWPCDTPNESDSLQDLASDKIYHLFGNRRFRNYEHFGQTSKDAKFVRGGEPCPTIGEFANIRKRKRGTILPPTKRYLDKVHLDIVFGDTISKLGFRYAILLIDRATKYIWFYGVKSLVSACSIDALEQFRADAGGLPK
jgi:hypothetical protein